MNNYDDLRVQLGLKPGNNASKGTSPYKDTSYSSTLSNNLSSTKNRRDEEERRRKEEEQKRQEAERRRKEQQRDAKLRAVEDLAHTETPTSTKAGTTTRPTYSSHTLNRYSDNTINKLPKQSGLQAYKQWYENDYKVNDLKKYNDYGMGLRQDFKMNVDYANANGLSEEDTIKLVTPDVDTRVEDRLQSIANKARSSEGNNWIQEVGQSIQEGWYEKEVYNMLSKEAYRQLQGLPNKVDKINQFIENNPDLFTQENGKAPYQMLRGATGVFRQGYDNYKETFQDPGTYLVIAGIYGLSYASAAAATAVTGGIAALPVFGTATTAATKVSTLYALSKGMSYGSFKNMAELEAGGSYMELREENVPHEIAKPIAQTIGVINGMIEFAQLDTALGMIPGFDTAIDAVKQQVTKDATKKVMKVLATYGVDLGGNIVEELLQGSYSYAAVELGKYLKDTPEPNSMEMLGAMGKMFNDEEYWREMKDTAKSSLYSFALPPIISSGARYAGSKTVEGLSNRLQQNYVNEYSDADYKEAQKQKEKLKEVITAENGITDKLIQRVNETLDPEAIAILVSEKQILESHMNRADTTNQEKALFQETVEKVDNVLSKVMYDTKDENPNIEYRPTNRQDVESEVANVEFAESNLDIINPRFNVTAVEYYNVAKDSGTLETIKEGLKEGKEKSKIVNEITKSLPRKERSPINVMAIVNAVETVESEIDSQIVMNNIYNLEQVQENLPDISVDSNIVPETNENIIEATEPPVGEETKGSQPTSQIESESSTEELTEPPSNIEVETDTNEEGTSKFPTSNVVKVPVSKIHVDADRFQFRYSGTTKKLDGATFNQDLSSPLMLWEDEYGDLYVVNGHHRLRLAEQSGTQEVEAKIYTSQEYSDTAIRALGAIVNIAENNAEAIDVAKVLRDSTITADELKKYVSPRSKVMKDGIALSNLNDWIFTQVATSKIPADIGVVIGNELPGNKVGQNQIVKAVDKLQLQGKDITASILTEMVAEVKGTAQETYTEQTLFGEETFTKSVQYERASLVEYVKGQLKSKKSLLKSVTKDKNTSMLESLGNKIAADENTEQLEQSELALLLLDKTLNYQGTKVNKLFNDLALEYSRAEPKDRAAIKRKALDELISLMEGGNLLGENETTKSKRKASSIIRAIQDSNSDGERGQESINDSDQIITEEQEEIAGQESLFALREQPQVEIIADDDVKNTRAYKSTIKIAGALQKNVLFNGLKVNYSNKSGKIVFESKKELKERGYEHYEVGKTYYIYGAYDNRTRTITLNSEAARDTILEEAIHDIQARIQEINPELGVTIQAWENEVREQATALGYEIPGGHELLAQAIVFSELGYASSNKDIANLIAVDDEIVVGIKAILGRDVLKEGQGLVESETAKKDRELKGMYENYAKRIFTQDGFLDNLLEAEENRKTEIRAELANARAATYYHPSNGQYAIVSPSTKGAKYQVTTFSPKFGAISDGQFDTIDEVADRLIDNKFYYKANEIHYQLKQFTRGVVDELYGIAISRGYRTDNNTRANRERVSFQLNDTQIIEAYHDAQIGNFSAQDFDELILHNKDVEDRVKQTIISKIRDAIDKGYDVPNSEVRIGQYLNRFYNIAMPTIKDKRFDLRVKNNKVELGVSGFQLDGEREFYKYDAYNTLEEAISDYKENLFLFEETDLDKALNEIVEKDFSYTVEMLRASKGITKVNAKQQVFNDIKSDYQEFRDNMETYRHKGLNYNFDMKPHYAISYQLKEATNIDTPEFKNWFRNSKVVDSEGNPLVVYHGTTHKWEVYSDVRGNIENDLGKGFYATSSEYDANDNYLSEGADLTSRIGRRRDELESLADYDEYDFIELVREYLPEIDVDAEGFDLAELDTRELALQIAKLEMVGSEETVMEVFLQMEYPFVMDGWNGGSQIAFEPNEDIQNRINEIDEQLKTEEDEDVVYELEEERQQLEDEQYEDAEGEAQDLYNAINQLGYDYNVDGYSIWANLAERLDFFSGVSAYELVTTMKADENIAFLESEEGGLAGNQFIQDVIKEMGYDGIIYEDASKHFPNMNMSSGTKHYIVFNPTQIKSLYNNGMFNEYDPNINYQLKESNIVNVDGFYSNLENVLNDKMGKRAKASEIMNMLTKNGVKPEEMEWFEIANFLEGKDFVYKNEILDHMRAKAIEFTKEDMGSEFESYTLPGGDNYSFNAYVYANNPGKSFMNEQHFGYLANVIGHTRYTDREGANGEKILLIEELQSDWHQKGRQEGYILNDSGIAAILEKYGNQDNLLDKVRQALEADDYLGFDYIHHAASAIQREPLSSFDELSIGIQQGLYQDYKYYMALSEQEGKQVPDAPLKESITDFLIKQAIKDAVEGGYDSIAWTTGKQQADRYSLTNVIDKLQIYLNPTDKTYNVKARSLSNGRVIENNNLSEKELADMLGKEMANTIIADTNTFYDTYVNSLPESFKLERSEGLWKIYEDGELKDYVNDYVLVDEYGDNSKIAATSYTIDYFTDLNKEHFLKTYEGLDLETGGEFHKKLYDNYVPRMLRKYGRKWGLTPETIDIANNLDFNEQLLYAARNGQELQEILTQPSIPVTPEMIEDVMTQGQPLFQLKEVPETNGNLLTMHNIDKNKLKNAIKLGGFPMPSIAVAKKDLQYTDFGNITLLFGKDTIDPQASKLNKVYSGDAYTPVFPTVYNKINEDVARKLNNMVYDRIPSELRDRFGTMLDKDNISDKIDRWGSFKDAYSNDVGLMVAYLNEKDIPFETATTEKEYGGWDYELLDKLAEKFPVLYDEKYIDMNVANEIAPELTDIMNDYTRETFKESFPDFTLFQETMEFGQIDRLARNVYGYVTDENRTVIDRNETEQNIKNAINEDDFSNWLEEISEGIIEKTGFRNNKDIFTPSGNRRKWETLHEEVTLDNVVRAMKQEPDQAAAGSGGIGQFMAANAQEFKSIQHIRDSIDMLVDLDPEEFKELREEYSNRLFNIANKIKNPRVSNQFMALDSATDILIENIRDHKTKSGIIKGLQADEKSGYISLSNFSESELFDLIDDVKEMPTQYFEAKPRRAVRFNEVQAALIDESRLSGEEELAEIKDMLKSVGVNVVETYSEDNRQQAMDNILRQNDVSFQLKETDTTTPAFKNWFKDSKVVDVEGKPLKVYHGSPSQFTEFRPSTAPGWGEGMYFTDNKDDAMEYSYDNKGNKLPLYEVYLNIQNPYTDATRLSNSDIENTKVYKEMQSKVPMVDGEYDYFIDARELFGEDGEFANSVIRELGYDGIVTEGSNNINGKEIVVFDPKQIKSVYNYGTWDANNPNIYYQLKEADTTTDQFKKWFKDSKVVDEDGKPLMVYHGTEDAGFEEFVSYSSNHYFTSSEETASTYANGEYGLVKPGSNLLEGLYPVYLNIQSPYVIEGYGSNWDNINGKSINDWVDEIKSTNEYDGVIFKDVIDNHPNWDIDNSSNIYVVFNANRIKSAYNQETWETNNPNIYYQLKEEPDLEERSWGQTVRDSSIVSEELKDLLTNNKFMYEVKHNKNTILAAAGLIDKKSEEWVEARVLSDLDDDAVLFAASQILTFKYMEQGETDRAMRIVEKSAEKATSAGQAIQILSVWGRQTPEGMLRSVTKLYRDTMTDADRQKILDRTNKLKDEFNKLNVEGVNSIDLVGAIKDLDEQSSQERLKRQLAGTEEGRSMVEKYGVEDIMDKAGSILPEDISKIESFLEKTPIDSDMTDTIIKTIKDHYTEGKGNLKDKLKKLGINDFEAEILSMYVKQQMRDYAKEQKISLIGELPKQKYERKGIDQQILDMVSEGKVDENLLKNLVGEKEGMPVLSRDLVDYIYQQGQHINSLELGRERDVETGKLIAQVMDNVPVSMWQKIRTFQTIAQLLNFKTTIRNLIGNDMFRRVDTFTMNTLGAGLDTLLAKGDVSKRTTLFRPIKANKAQKLGYREGWRLGLEDALLGIDTSGETGKFELKSTRTFKHGVMAQLETALNVAMRATDRAAFTASFMDSLDEQMQIAGVDTPTEAMVENATQLGLYRTFNDTNKISEMFSGIKRSLNKLGSPDGEFGLGELVMKYPKTPANILGRAVDYSPVGLLLTAMHLKTETTGDAYIRQRMKVEGVSRALMGTGLIAIGALLARLGILTGSNPDDDEDIYELEKQYGLRDFSVNVSAINRYIMSGFTDSKAGELRKGDIVASYDWAEPLAMSLAIGADTELGSGEAKDLISTVVRAVEAGTTTLADQPLLTGVSNMFRYGDVVQGFTQILKQMPSSFTPTLFSQVAQFLDGRDTDPYSFYGTGQQAWNLVQNRLPGLRDNIPGRYSVLGDERRYQPQDRNAILKAVNTFLNPAITNQYMPNEEAEFIFDLYESSGDPDIVPRKPQKSYTFNGEKVTPTPEEWQEWSKWLGETTRKEMDRAINGYMRGWSAEEQADEIKWIIKDTRNRLRDKIEKEKVK